MTRIMQQMREELVRRNYAESTMRSYLGTVEDFRRYFQKRLDHMEAGDIRRYQVHLLEERKLGVGTVINHVAALRFLYVKTLKRREMKEDLPYPKHEKPLPVGSSALGSSALSLLSPGEGVEPCLSWKVCCRAEASLSPEASAVQ